MVFILFYSACQEVIYIQSLTGLIFLRSHIISSILSIDHWSSESRIGFNDFALSVRAYSTLGGISENIVLVTYPSSSNVRSVIVSIFCDISGICCFSSIKRMLSFSDLSRIYMTSNAHLSHNLANMFLTGQPGNMASCTVDLFMDYLYLMNSSAQR